MKDLCKKVVRFLLDEQGPTTVEYAMVLLLIFLAFLTAAVVLGQATATSYTESSHSVSEAIDASR
jgi:Flp pilus assembly pilin Flp